LKILGIIGHVIMVILLTLLTQVGGLIWIINYSGFKSRKQEYSKVYKFLFFVFLYLVTSILLVPPLSKLNNRVPLPIFKNGKLIPHNYMTPLLNRHYVRPILKSDLLQIASELSSEDQKVKLSYLDANFPFINGFPLLPHLSHNDGRKVDLSFFYMKDNLPVNLKPSNTGYGAFVPSHVNGKSQTEICKEKGYWQYDYPKYLTLGSRDDLQIDEKKTRELIIKIINRKATQKLFVEPHLKNRLKLNHSKIRFHGCQAVRHDDHIHYQIN